MPPYTFTTFAQRPDLEDASYDLNGLAWPAFMLEDPVTNISPNLGLARALKFVVKMAHAQKGSS